MLFNSMHFVLFFLLVTPIYFVLPHKFRWMWLLAASCYFYMAFVPVYILILGFTIVIDYFAGIYIEQSIGKKRKLFLIFSLIANVGVLAFFKYYNFINENITSILYGMDYENPIPNLTILLPIGLSFHTFQAMSYTIEVYRGNQKAERHFGIYSLYVMFYPQLVAGPIERPQNLLHQFHKEHEFSYDRMIEGLKLMVWGYFMKLVVADRLAIYVDAVYDNYEMHSGKTLALATMFFAIQIYCDFAGYSNIAIGSARIMGFDLMTNFNRPYFSKSISEFWSRWHISLSTWFKDYLYISLGGNRVSVPRWYFNLFIVFLLSGLWHGANWTFVIWGGLNGFYLVFAIITEKVRNRINSKLRINYFPSLINIIQVAVTFVLISISWVFFRSSSAHQGVSIIRDIVSFDGDLFLLNRSVFILSVFSLVLLGLGEYYLEFTKVSAPFLEKRQWLPASIVYAVIVIFILSIGSLNGGQFIYFQF